jgi:hypothetical protein
MDIQMPHISGLELIDQLKADDELKTIPVMAVTAYAAKGDEERIRDAGAEGYVSKPISVMRFIEAVRELLEAAQARAADAEAKAAEAAAAAADEAEATADEDEPAAAEAESIEAGPCEPVLLEAEPEALEGAGSNDEQEQPGREPGDDLFSRHAGQGGHPGDGGSGDSEPDPASSPG